MMRTKILMLIVATGLLGGCENMSPGQKGAVTGAGAGHRHRHGGRRQLRRRGRRRPDRRRGGYIAGNVIGNN
jgi:hypothetical protein